MARENSVPCSTCQIHNGARQILRHSPSTSRYSADDGSLPLLIRPDALRQLGGYIPRRQRRHADAFPHPLVAQGLGELADGAFGRDVGADVQAAGESQHRGDVNDLLLVRARRRRRRQPVFGEGACEDEGCRQVDLDDLCFPYRMSNPRGRVTGSRDIRNIPRPNSLPQSPRRDSGVAPRRS